jgi:hypothetical protein
LIDTELTPPSYSGKNAAAQVGWGFLWVVFFCLAAAGIAGYAVYKYRIRVCDMINLLHSDYQLIKSRTVPPNFLSASQRYMDSEIRAIMAQYMPLDNQGDHSNHIEM